MAREVAGVAAGGDGGGVPAHALVTIQSNRWRHRLLLQHVVRLAHLRCRWRDARAP